MNHDFDRYSMALYLQGKEQVNADEVVKAFNEIQDHRIRAIILAYITDKETTFAQVGKAHHISRQYAHKLYKKGIDEIKRKLGLVEG
jgi:DNA-directed RNA polymerase specialized sigma subunit